MTDQKQREAIAARTEARELFWGEHEKTEYSCPDCEYDGDHLDVHHIDGEPYNNTLENLVGLCHWCHARRHRRESIDARLDDMRVEFEAITA